MAENIEVDFKNLSAERKADLQRAVNRAVASAGQIVADQIKELTPVDTGGLKGSVKKEVLESGSSTVAKVYTNKNYAPYVEFGTGEFAENGAGRKTPWAYKSGNKFYRTKGMKGQKFMRNGFREAKPKALQTLKGIIGGAFK